MTYIILCNSLFFNNIISIAALTLGGAIVFSSVLMFSLNFNKYLNGMYDARIVYYLTFSIEFFIIAFIIMLNIVNGIISSKFSFLMSLVLTCFTNCRAISRLYVFPATKISNNEKRFHYLSCQVIFFLSTMIILVTMNFSNLKAYNCFENEMILNTYNYLVNMSIGTSYNVYFCIFLVIAPILYQSFSIYFDLKEKREKKYIIFDLLSSIPIGLLIIHSISNSKFLYYLSPVSFWMIMATILITISYTLKDIKQQSSGKYYYVDHYNQTIKSIKNDTSKNSIYIMNALSEILSKPQNEVIKDILFEKIRFGKQKQIINIIKQKVDIKLKERTNE